MPLSAGSRLGPYELVSVIGAGGMGEVYRARDLRLGRDVAVKVLASALSVDSERLRRFEQEARAAAALNHPNILAVYDVGHQDSGPYIVSELLEGETLRGRLKRHTSDARNQDSDAAGLSVRRALDYAIQIAHGLAAAHAKGIIHRDLKPENLFITKDGRVKILDFGLAKLTETAMAAGATMMTPAAVETSPGMLLGTVGYMSPEQVRAQPSDHRSDIFALGAILYEMLSGRRAFDAATSADTIGAILNKDPQDLPVTERHVAPALVKIVDRCLEKEPAARFQSTVDLAFALEAVSAQPDVSSKAAAPAGSTLRQRRPWAAMTTVATLAGLIGAGAAYMTLHRPSDAEDPIRFSITAPPGTLLGVNPAGPALAISPDGRNIVFAAARNNAAGAALWLRRTDALDARLLPGSDIRGVGGGLPFWSPDGRFIAFFAEGKLKRIDLAGGGRAEVICDVRAPVIGGTWSRSGEIVFVSAGSLMRVAAAGGEPTPLIQPPASGTATSDLPRWPSFLPDGTHFLYFVAGDAVMVRSLDGRDSRRVVSAQTKAKFSNGHVLFVRSGALLAQRFDTTRLQVEGEPITIAQPVRFNPTGGAAAFDSAENGTLVYRAGEITTSFASRLTWLDRAGKVLGEVGEPADYRGVALSPDGRHLAVHPHDNVAGGDLWIHDLERGSRTRLTVGGHNTSPVWSADGKAVMYASNRTADGSTPSDPVFGGIFNLLSRPADLSSEPVAVLNSAESKLPAEWKQPTSLSRDGKLLIFEISDLKTRFDLWAQPLDGDGKPRLLLRTPFQEYEAQISPDGRWLAYTSDESQVRNDVYLRPLDGGSGRALISTAGGRFPAWRRDGKELYFISPDRKMMAVSISTSGGQVEAGIPQTLFDARGIPDVYFPNASQGGGAAKSPIPYAITADGQRFLVVLLPETEPNRPEDPLVVVTNWPRLLRSN